MEREEAIKTLKGEAWICCTEKWNEALEIAIKALEHPERNAIAEITNDIHKCNNTDMAFGMQHTLDIIDKYKAEGSEK